MLLFEHPTKARGSVSPLARSLAAITSASFGSGTNNTPTGAFTSLGLTPPTVNSRSAWDDATSGSVEFQSSGNQTLRFDNAALGTGDFTIEAVCLGTSWFFDWREVNLETSGMLIGLEPTYARIDTSASYRVATVADATQWNYLCVQRKAGVVYVSVNNKLLGSRADATNYTRSSVWLASGMGASRVYNNQTMAAFRVVTGKALYDGAASPFPDAPLAAVSGGNYQTVALLAPNPQTAQVVDAARNSTIRLASTTTVNSGFIEFDGGANSYVQVPGAYFADQNFMVEFKYTPTTTSHVTYPTIFTNSLGSYADTPAYFGLTERHSSAPTKYSFGAKALAVGLYSKTDVQVGVEVVITLLRYENRIYLLINGEIEDSAAISGALDVAGSGQSLYFGRSGTNVPTGVVGKIRDIHIVRGTYRTGAYNPAYTKVQPEYVEEAADPYYDQVVLQLDFGSVSGRRNTIVDVKGHPLTFIGTYARTTNRDVIRGKRAMYLDGTSWITTPDSNEFDWSNKPMCFECTVNLPEGAVLTQQQIIGQRNGTTECWQLSLYNSYMNGWFGGAAFPSVLGSKLAPGFDYALAWVYENGMLRTYIDGVLNSSGFAIAPPINVSAPIYIGACQGYGNQYAKATIGNMRLTIGSNAGKRYLGDTPDIPNTFVPHAA